MLDNASRIINKRIGLEESDKNFLLAIEPDDDCRFLCEDIDGQNLLGNGDYKMINNGYNFFDEATEYDPDLTTSLQDETDADDDNEFDVTNDFESDVDLTKEVNYDDDFEKDYKADFEPDTNLDDEVDYVDDFDDDADVSGFVSVDESADFLMEDDLQAECGDLDECGDDLEEDFEEDSFFFEDVDINIDPNADVDVNVGGDGADDVSSVSDCSGDVEGLDDDDSKDGEAVDESFDWLLEDGVDCTIPSAEDTDDITFDDGQSTDVIEQDDPDDVGAFIDDDEHDDDDIDLDSDDLVEDILMQ